MFPQPTDRLNDLNPFLALNFEPAFEQLGDDYYDTVAAAEFPRHMLRFRNDEVLQTLGLDAQTVTDADFIAVFGQFQNRQPLLAMRYHGYQFGEYNPFLGDGRGFLYGQVRGIDGELYDFGTKGSGRTPYSRGADGRLTLKGGVREVLAAEMLYRLGVRTSRCLSLVETGESLWRGDEPSPTRSSVMVRFSRSHIRFGTFERLHYISRKDLIQKLLDHVVTYYYPHLLNQQDAYLQFYRELVQRTADLTAQWMSVGFCHAVLNTDNMSITGESFDYGPYAFMEQYDPKFTAAYFDYSGRYAYANQPIACLWNLQKLQVPLKGLIDPFEMEAALAEFDRQFQTTYRERMLRKLGFEISFDQVSIDVGDELLRRTLQLLWETKVGYHDFFMALRQQFDHTWREDATLIFNQAMNEAPPEKTDAVNHLLNHWREFYHQVLNSLPVEEMEAIERRLRQHNPITVILRPEIEAVWEPITQEDNWQPFYELLERIWRSVEIQA
ncbi:protein adenylyltransferase SelO [Egbenema bharatensis]|uniref:protein adenylyltransferase SelO n=1 Tax=Egbenema bharatensis TaxID=3463334 RepID=UPI003A85A81E